MPPAKPVPSELRGRPFGVAEAARHGLTRQNLGSRAYRRLFRGVHVEASVPMTYVLWLLAGLLVMPTDAVVSHLSALRAWGFDPRVPGPLEYSTNTASTTAVPGCRLHRRRGRLRSVARSGLPVTEPERTFVDCATRLGVVALVQAAEHLLHTGATTHEQLLRYCAERHLDGVVRARRAMALVREHVESPMETLVRLMLVFARLPCPEPNVRVRDARGTVVARVDLLYARYRVVVEYDGADHLSPARRQRDRRRREALEALGYRVIVIAAEDMAAPRSVPWRVHAALAARGYEGPRPVTSDVWQRWFTS